MSNIFKQVNLVLNIKPSYKQHMKEPGQRVLDSDILKTQQWKLSIFQISSTLENDDIMQACVENFSLC